MIKYLNQLSNPYMDHLNVDLMNRTADSELKDFIIDAWKSLEILPSIKIIKFEFNDVESTIDYNKYVYRRGKNTKKNEKIEHKFINESRCGVLTTHIQVSLYKENKDTDEMELHSKVFKKPMLIPIIDEETGCYTSKGKQYYMIYQLLEKSTYTASTTVTLKSLMPVALSRKAAEIEAYLVQWKSVNGMEDDEEITSEEKVMVQDVNEMVYKIPVYKIFVFKTEVPVLIFYFANGFDHALSYLGVSNVISIESTPDYTDEKYLYFPASKKCIIKVDKDMFIRYPYIQSIVGGILINCNEKTTVESLRDRQTWIKKLGKTPEKGQDMLIMFNRLLDETTKKILRLDPYHKETIYSVIRWMMMSYNELRLKDNMDLNNKRLRINEYIQSLFTLELSKKIYKLITLGKRATMDDFKKAFNFTGEILIQKMHNSGILTFDDRINDMTFFSKFKVTTKGPHSLGGKNKRNIPIKQRGLHPSYLGYLDILVCGNSDRVGQAS